MPGIAILYNQILAQVEVDLKTIAELADNFGGAGKKHVFFWKGKPGFIASEYDATIVPGSVAPVEGTTSHSTWDEFTIFVDLLYYRKADETLQAAYLLGLTVAEKIYDKFHLTKVGNLVRICRVTIFPGEGAISQRNIDAIPFRVELLCEVAITQ